jgi:hypothetical protein
MKLIIEIKDCLAVILFYLSWKIMSEKLQEDVAVHYLKVK